MPLLNFKTHRIAFFFKSTHNTHLSGSAASAFPLRNTMSKAMKHLTIAPVPSIALTSPATAGGGL